MKICEYGCERKAIKELKNGRWCCSEYVNSCPSVRKKNSESGKCSWLDGNRNMKDATCKFCNREMPICGMASHEKNCYLNPDNKKLCPVCDSPIKNWRTSSTCGYGCANKHFRSKELHWNYKNGDHAWARENGINLGEHNYPKDKRIKGRHDYRYVCFTNHEKACIVCGEDKVVSVHHYDEDRKNNVPENLVPLCLTHHTYMHSKFKHLVEKRVKEYIDNWIEDNKEKFSAE